METSENIEQPIPGKNVIVRMPKKMLDDLLGLTLVDGPGADGLPTIGSTLRTAIRAYVATRLEEPDFLPKLQAAMSYRDSLMPQIAETES